MARWSGGRHREDRSQLVHDAWWAARVEQCRALIHGRPYSTPKLEGLTEAERKLVLRRLDIPRRGGVNVTDEPDKPTPIEEARQRKRRGPEP